MREVLQGSTPRLLGVELRGTMQIDLWGVQLSRVTSFAQLRPIGVPHAQRGGMGSCWPQSVCATCCGSSNHDQ